MSPTISSQGDRVELELSDMRLALNITKMAKEGLSRATIEETKCIIQKPHTKVCEEETRGVEFPGYNKMRAAIQRNPAMLRNNQTSGCLPCQNRNAKNLLMRWRRQGTCAPPPTRRTVQTPQLTLPLSGTPPTPTGNTFRTQPSEIINLPPRYKYSPTALSRAEFLDDDENTQHHTNVDPDMLTDEG